MKQRIDFDLLFEDTNKLKYTLTKEKRDKIYGKIEKIQQVNLKQIMLIILVKKIFWIKNEEKIIQECKVQNVLLFYLFSNFFNIVLFIYSF